MVDTSRAAATALGAGAGDRQGSRGGTSSGGSVPVVTDMAAAVDLHGGDRKLYREELQDDSSDSEGVAPVRHHLRLSSPGYIWLKCRVYMNGLSSLSDA